VTQVSITEQSKLTVKTEKAFSDEDEDKPSQPATERYAEPYSPNIFVYKNQLKEQQQNMIRMKQKVIEEKEKTACSLKR
jgi:hypothetical protein